MTQQFNPPHPGAVLADGVIGGELTVTAFAKRLGIARGTLSRVLHGHAAVTAELALRLQAALGGSAESWLAMQAAYDLWVAAKHKRPKIARLPAAAMEHRAAA
jgi:antitoxin HigA-1